MEQTMASKEAAGQSGEETETLLCPFLPIRGRKMFSLGKVSAMKVATLKASYKLLQNTLRSTQASELRLHEEAERSRAMLEELQAQEEQAEEEQVTYSPPPAMGGQEQSESSWLRRQLLQAYNVLKVAQDRECFHRLVLERLREEKLCLEKECVEAQPKPTSLDALRERREELMKEVTQRQLEVRSLTEVMEATTNQNLKQQKELEDMKDVIEKTQAEQAQLLMAPNQLLKEMDRVRRKKADAGQKVASLEAEAGALKEQLIEEERRPCQLKEERRELSQEGGEWRARVEAAAKQHGEMLKERAAMKELELSLQGERDVLEMKLMDLVADSKLLNESLYMQQKEKDRQMRALKQMEVVLQQATNQLVETQSLYSKTKAQRDAGLKGDGGSGAAQMRVEKEVDSLKANLKHQHGLVEEGGRVEQQGAQVHALMRESSRLLSEIHSLGRLTQIKVHERDQKHRHMRRAEQTKAAVEQECREKDLVIMDLQKLQTALQHRLSQRAEAYKLVQGEKNRNLAQRDSVAREIAELTEKSSTLDNEVEILRTTAIKKDRALAEARKKHSQSRKQQESLRKSISKVDWHLREMGDQIEENAVEERKLRQAADRLEQTLLDMTKSYNAATQSRNTLSIQLLEREAEACVLYQRFNAQGAAVAGGNAALDDLEEDVRSLRLDEAEERWRVGLETERASHAHSLEGELATLQIELSKARDEASELDRAALRSLSGDSSKVFKELKGSGPPADELIQKTEHLEERLAKCEEQLMEKELLLDQVTRLSQPIREQLNELRSQSNMARQRVMAVAAELSMRQAQALALEQEVREKQLQVSCTTLYYSTDQWFSIAGQVP
ncbi:Coiled-coil domain-containing protein 146 [Merluccius polli]|uniref:Coiled-coil domain-containing protein 146 n=1 Tax=Merluccius polli TaxID=89951 RepID=A0AA47M0J1_MERPO|nr:Coiled-coil domain-containing protein 146 [Merluccius polli]